MTILKQLIVTATPLFKEDTLGIIYYIYTNHDFIILAQYPLHNNETLFFMEYTLYRLDKTKIAFENYCPINTKLFWPMSNYLKFHAMIHFIKYIQDYKSAINHDIEYNKAVHK